ncbi:MAG TPA: DUF2922 domain-containing protein [Caldisericia bacterium]|nr:DUF2922 domain-containing protein [Caldisericia bacterium]
MDKQVYITFSTETEGRNYIMRFNNPKDTISQTDIENFANWVISQNMFLTRYGELVALVDGGIIQTTKTDLIPPIE